MSLHPVANPYDDSKGEINRNVNQDSRLTLGQILKQKCAEQGKNIPSESGKFSTISLRSVPVEPIIVRPKNDHVSCGILLFDQDGFVLTVIRPHSYAFASMMMMLISPPENRTKQTYIEMIREFTEEEYEIVKKNWIPEGLNYVVDNYLIKLTAQFTEVRKHIQRKFEINYNRMKFEWKQIVKKIPINEVQRDRTARIHDFPKGRKPQDSSKSREDIIRYKFKQETLHDLPNDIIYGPWIKVGYESSDGAWYNFELVSAKCKRFELKSEINQWILPDDLQVIEDVRKAVKESWTLVADK